MVAEHLGRVTVLDISAAALARACERLGARAGEVTWIEADVTGVELPAQTFDVWHDCAAFHFHTEAEDRSRYVANAAALRPGGTLLIATFAPDGPRGAAGSMSRATPESLAREFGEAFVLRQGFADVHHTPDGAEQRFTYAVLQRR